MKFKTHKDKINSAADVLIETFRGGHNEVKPFTNDQIKFVEILFDMVETYKLSYSEVREVFKEYYKCSKKYKEVIHERR